MLDTGDTYDFVFPVDTEVTMAFSMILNGEEQLGSFKMKLKPAELEEKVETWHRQVGPTKTAKGQGRKSTPARVAQPIGSRLLRPTRS